MDSTKAKISIEYTMEELLTQNQSLAEELSQCKADKEFVWTLWKRLQSSQPEMTSVISMVVAREKEKIEKKDQKILEILQTKDEKIKELEEMNSKIEVEGKDNSERVHSLLMENLDLKERFEELQKASTKREKDLLDENLYLNEVVKARQGQLETQETKFKVELAKFEHTKNELQGEMVKLDSEIMNLAQAKETASNAVQRSHQLEEKIKTLEKELTDQRQKNDELSTENEDLTAKLRTREGQLEQHSKAVESHIDEMEQKTQAIIQLRQEYKELHTTHSKCNQHITEQAVVIEQLQGLQTQTQQVLTKQEESYKQETASLQRVIISLKQQCEDVHQSRQRLEEKVQRKVEELENICQSQSQLLIEKDVLIKELRSEPQSEDEPQITTSTPIHKTPESSELARKLSELEEENESLRDVLQERLRRISSLEKILKSKHIENQGISQEKRRDTQEDESEETDQETAVSEELQETRQILQETKARLGDVQSLLDLKENELSEMRKAHDRRHQRLKTLQEAHNLVLEQLTTYENGEEEEKKKKKNETPVKRPPPRELQQEDKDGVWNELTYFRREYEKLHKERIDWEEEVDVLRVQHANDLAIIQELRIAVQSGKEEIVEEMRRESEEKQQELVEAEKQLLKWQQKAMDLELELEEVDKDREQLEKELKVLRKQIKSSSPHRSPGGKKTDIGTSPLRKQNELNKSIHKLGTILAGTDTGDDGHPENTGEEAESRGGSSSHEHIEKQLKPITDYEEHVRRIGENLDQHETKKTTSTSPRHPSPQRSSSRRSPSKPLITRYATATQTDPETSDFGTNVDMDEADSDTDTSMSEGEVRKGKTPRKRTMRKQDGGTPYKMKKMGVLGKRTPSSHREWLSMKHRVQSLSQQVTVLRSSRNSALKSLTEQKETNDRLQAELNLANQRLKVGKQSTQKLAEELEEVTREKHYIQTSERNAEKNEQHSQLEWKKLEDRLKLTSNECSRLSFLVKSLRTENEELKEKLKDIQEKTSRLERDVVQKKNLIEEMRGKVKTSQEKADKNSETAKELEDKLKRANDRESQKKSHVDSLKRHVETETKEKKKYQQMYFALQQDLRKKDHIIAESESVRSHAEMAVSEMETAAQQQLQSLANQSETAIKLLHQKLEKMNKRNEEFQIFVKTLADELLQQLRRTREAINLHEQQQQQKEMDIGLGKKAMRHAQDIACSILDMSSTDLESFMEEDLSTRGSIESFSSEDKEKVSKIDKILQKQTSFAVPLLQVLLGLIDERVNVITSDS